MLVRRRLQRSASTDPLDLAAPSVLDREANIAGGDLETHLQTLSGTNDESPSALPFLELRAVYLARMSHETALSRR